MKEHPTGWGITKMNERSKPHDQIVSLGHHQVTAELDIFVPVIRKFTLNYQGGQDPSGHEYSITMEVLQEAGLSVSADCFSLRMTVGSGDHTELMIRCLEVLEAGFIKAKGELVIDQIDGEGGGTERFIYLVEIHTFDAVRSLDDDETMTKAA